MHDIPRPMETFYLTILTFCLAIPNSKHKLNNKKIKATVTFLFLFCVVGKKTEM